eukprot:m.572344 g.572344  ORF g.572344 m.572344 type:complete len:653 (+) comp57864_c0_seq12:105-2063(+)
MQWLNVALALAFVHCCAAVTQEVTYAYLHLDYSQATSTSGLPVAMPASLDSFSGAYALFGPAYSVTGRMVFAEALDRCMFAAVSGPSPFILVVRQSSLCSPFAQAKAAQSIGASGILSTASGNLTTIELLQRTAADSLQPDPTIPIISISGYLSHRMLALQSVQGIQVVIKVYNEQLSAPERSSSSSSDGTLFIAIGLIVVGSVSIVIIIAIHSVQRMRLRRLRRAVARARMLHRLTQQQRATDHLALQQLIERLPVMPYGIVPSSSPAPDEEGAGEDEQPSQQESRTAQHTEGPDGNDELPDREQTIVQVLKRDAASEDLCAICLSEFESDELCRVLPCFHFLHKDCVDPWLKSKATCPLCKRHIGLPPIKPGSTRLMFEPSSEPHPAPVTLSNDELTDEILITTEPELELENSNPDGEDGDGDLREGNESPAFLELPAPTIQQPFSEALLDTPADVLWERLSRASSFSSSARYRRHSMISSSAASTNCDDACTIRTVSTRTKHSVGGSRSVRSARPGLTPRQRMGPQGSFISLATSGIVQMDRATDGNENGIAESQAADRCPRTFARIESRDEEFTGVSVASLSSSEVATPATLRADPRLPRMPVAHNRDPATGAALAGRSASGLIPRPLLLVLRQSTQDSISSARSSFV